ncbi:hypothetical protein HPB47_014658 [Ixodes persulcatus]|uniref:Uncharacterized protein n=1 Tax=Ixodes persulcatus TaxID=34615 RepID=A0AC60QXW3_IXOPE|nr:hypothetical protein HPB47_014658 [Ixodes persulcatus]
MANMDQTMVRMVTAANRTNKLVGTSTVRTANTACARQGFTVALAACTSGHKLPAFVILKEQVNVSVTALRNGWMTSEKFLEWLERIWGTNVDDVRQLLVLDNTPIQKTQAAKDTFQERNTNLVNVPAGCTSLPQHGDVFWNKPFKASLRRTWEAFMRKEEKTAEETCEGFPGRTC